MDHDCQVWLNGDLIGEHHGGYLPFSFDITNALDKAENEIVLAVQDASDSTSDPAGKQTLRRVAFGTRVSGIWQTVWSGTYALEGYCVSSINAACAGWRTLTINADVGYGGWAGRAGCGKRKASWTRQVVWQQGGWARSCRGPGAVWAFPDARRGTLTIRRFMT